MSSELILQVYDLFNGWLTLERGYDSQRLRISAERHGGTDYGKNVLFRLRMAKATHYTEDWAVTAFFWNGKPTATILETAKLKEAVNSASIDKESIRSALLHYFQEISEYEVKRLKESMTVRRWLISYMTEGGWNRIPNKWEYPEWLPALENDNSQITFSNFVSVLAYANSEEHSPDRIMKAEAADGGVTRFFCQSRQPTWGESRLTEWFEARKKAIDAEKSLVLSPEKTLTFFDTHVEPIRLKTDIGRDLAASKGQAVKFENVAKVQELYEDVMMLMNQGNMSISQRDLLMKLYSGLYGFLSG